MGCILNSQLRKSSPATRHGGASFEQAESAIAATECFAADTSPIRLQLCAASYSAAGYCHLIFARMPSISSLRKARMVTAGLRLRKNKDENGVSSKHLAPLS